jgi:hypothetical protein
LVENQPGGAASDEEVTEETEAIVSGPLGGRIERKKQITVPVLKGRPAVAAPAVAVPELQSLHSALQSALESASLKVRPLAVRSRVYRLPAPEVVGIGTKNHVTVDVPGYILSVAVLAENPNLEVELLLDNENFGVSMADLIQRQQAFLTATDWTITRQDPNVTPQQYAIAVFPYATTWSWEREMKFNLAVPSSIAQIGETSITVDQLVIKWVEY